MALASALVSVMIDAVRKTARPMLRELATLVAQTTKPFHISVTATSTGLDVAFADSGNKLTEPFTNYPVMIADESKMPFEANRVIPFSTVGGEGGLNAFKPDMVKISCGDNVVETDRIYIAKSKIQSKE